MTKAVLISGKRLCRVLEREGFVRTGQRGSHVRYRHADGRTTVVPVHGDEEIGPGLLHAILGQAGISRERYDELRRLT